MKEVMKNMHTINEEPDREISKGDIAAKMNLREVQRKNPSLKIKVI